MIRSYFLFLFLFHYFGYTHCHSISNDNIFVGGKVRKHGVTANNMYQAFKMIHEPDIHMETEDNHEMKASKSRRLMSISKLIKAGKMAIKGISGISDTVKNAKKIGKALDAAVSAKKTVKRADAVARRQNLIRKGANADGLANVVVTTRKNDPSDVKKIANQQQAANKLGQSTLNLNQRVKLHQNIMGALQVAEEAKGNKHGMFGAINSGFRHDKAVQNAWGLRGSRQAKFKRYDDIATFIRSKGSASPEELEFLGTYDMYVRTLKKGEANRLQSNAKFINKYEVQDMSLEKWEAATGSLPKDFKISNSANDKLVDIDFLKIE